MGGWPTVYGLLLMPFVWSLPLGLMTAELGAMIPENGGYVVWVERAFGPALGWVVSVLGIWQALFDSSLYPRMFTDYLRAVLTRFDM